MSAICARCGSAIRLQVFDPSAGRGRETHPLLPGAAPRHRRLAVGDLGKHHAAHRHDAYGAWRLFRRISPSACRRWWRFIPGCRCPKARDGGSDCPRERQSPERTHGGRPAPSGATRPPMHYSTQSALARRTAAKCAEDDRDQEQHHGDEEDDLRDFDRSTRDAAEARAHRRSTQPQETSTPSQAWPFPHFDMRANPLGRDNPEGKGVPE